MNLGDIARLVVINTRLSSSDVPALLEPVDPSLWAEVPRDASFFDLPDDPVGDPVYDAINALYDAYRKKGLGATKRTKTLHLKRPSLVPIVDSVAKHAYRSAAKQAGNEAGSPWPLFWIPIWRDARSNSTALVALADTLTNDGGIRASLAALSPLRMHDVIVWSHFRATCPLDED